MITESCKRKSPTTKERDSGTPPWKQGDDLFASFFCFLCFTLTYAAPTTLLNMADHCLMVPHSTLKCPPFSKLGEQKHLLRKGTGYHPYFEECRLLLFIPMPILPKTEPSNPQLSLLCVYRNHDFLERAYGNYWGLCYLLNLIACETNMEPGTLTCISSHAYI